MTYFRAEEFSCKCGCGLNNISPKLVDMLNVARDWAGIPFLITSGCRCEAHNKAVGGTPESSHLSGLAVDIAAIDNDTRERVLGGLYHAKFRRKGIGTTFIHADIDLTKPQWVAWLY